MFKKYKTFSLFPYSYKNTSGSLGKREIEVGTRALRTSDPRNFEFSQNFHKCFYIITYGNTGKNVSYFFYKITTKKNVEIAFLIPKA